MSDTVKMYADFISEQVKKRGDLVESAEDKATKAYKRHKNLSKNGYDLDLNYGKGFFHKNNDGPDQTYIVQHASGKHSMTTIDHMKHGGIADYKKQSQEQNPHLSDKEHDEVADIIDKNFNQ